MAALASSGVTAAPAAADQPSGRGHGGTTREITLYMEQLSDGRMGYGLERGKASVPGPLLEMYEGDTLHITVVNTLDVPASLHVHGVDYTIDSDGTVMTDSVVPAGGQRVYTWRAHHPGRRKDGTWDHGSAGYWGYHDHAVGTDHGTGGIRAGLYGGLVVRRKGDPLPDKQFTIVFNDMTINNHTGRDGDDTPTFTARLGERCEVVMLTHGDFFHTFHLHGHRWADNRTGILADHKDTSRIIDNKTVGPGDSFGFQVLAGEHVGPGHWMYHCHVQSHADMGMAGVFVVKED